MLESSPFDLGKGYDTCKQKYLDALDKVVWYNCLGKCILAWKNITPNTSGCILPNYWDHDYGVETTAQLELIWMIAVIRFGDYGTSPRSGWISDISGFHKFIDAITETYRNDP